MKLPRYFSNSLRRLVLLAPVALAFGACDRPEYTYSDDVQLNPGNNGQGNFGNAPIATSGTTFGTAGSSTVGPGGPTGGGPACLIDRTVSGPAIFTNQAVNNRLAARTDVYFYVTDSEAKTLKATGELLPAIAQTTTPSALTQVLQQLSTTANALRRPLILELMERFKVTRATWPNPWALRLIDHPGSQHMNAVRVRFKKDAWIVRIVDGSPAISDINNAIVSIDAATAAPERIAAIYYIADDASGGNIATCENGKRELALGNPDMVEEFSLGTPEILARLDADLDALTALFDAARPCSSFDRAGMTFHAFTVCQTWKFWDTSNEYAAYQWSLANPMEAYKPTSQNLASLIEALKSDRSEPDPFVAKPGEPGDGGMGGAGGDGAGGASGTDGGAAPEGGAFSH